MSDVGQAMFTTPEMAALFSGRALVERMLAFEAALAQARTRAGVIPHAAAEAIASRCRVELIDLPALLRDAAASATPAVPLVRMVTAQVAGEAKRYVHWGAMSQDTVDTAVMLQVRDGLDLLTDRLLHAGQAARRSRRSTGARRWPAGPCCSRPCPLPSASRLRAGWLC